MSAPEHWSASFAAQSPSSVRAALQRPHGASPLHNSKLWGSLSRIAALPAASASNADPPIIKRRRFNDSVMSASTTKDFVQMVSSVVKNRTGAVLARQAILKSDHFPMGVNNNLDVHLQGSPNFRTVDLNVMGVAQPSAIGLSTILTLLNCHPALKESSSALWVCTREEPLVYINGRPYVLRDEENPLQNLRHFTGIAVSRLEQMEARLRDDIKKEAQKYKGLILVHDEAGSGEIIPCWLAATLVQTPREVIQSFQLQGYRVRYVRIPVAPEQSLGDRYLDEYVEILKTTPTSEALVVNCGMGGGRTTMGMVIALLIRRAQLMTEGKQDPFPLNVNINGNIIDLHDLHEAELSNKALLRLMYILEKGLEADNSPHSAIDWAISHSSLIDKLKTTALGNYHFIMELARLLDDGLTTKRLLDQIIDRCSAIINLREDILINRIRHSVTGDASSLRSALNCLERYFFLLAFAGYVDERGHSLNSIDTSNTTANTPTHEKSGEKGSFDISFSSWLAGRPEIRFMVEGFRNTANKLPLFRPVEDLSALSGDSIDISHHRLGVMGYESVAKELEKYVLKNRMGKVLSTNMIMKVDFWTQEKDMEESTMDGAARFRRIPGTMVYAVAQPTMQGMKNVRRRIAEDQAVGITDHEINESAVNMAWINLREEPLVYINGIPCVLRDQYATLRNIKVYGGITAARLELMEQRLKKDLVDELTQYDEKILLHSETANGVVVPIWEDVRPENLLTLREVADVLMSEGDNLAFHRVPITAEAVPDEADLDALVQVLGQLNHTHTAVVVNCQVGLGRSTFGTVVVCLLLQWLGRDPTTAIHTPPIKNMRPVRDSNYDLTLSSALQSTDMLINRDISTSGNSSDLISPSTASKAVYSSSSNKNVNYKVIHSLLRVIRNGVQVKRSVDETIDQCARFMNVRDSIEECRLMAESVSSEEEKLTLLNKGLSHLHRYSILVVFQAYLNDVQPDTIELLESFKSWVLRHPEILTIKAELHSEGVHALIPVEKQSPGDGIALTSEVMDVVNNRDGSVLGKHTILKHDAFPGCQKLSLPDRIAGAANFRKVSLASLGDGFSAALRIPVRMDNSVDNLDRPSVYGVSMPTKDGIKNVLSKMDAGITGQRRVLWTCLREEPALYIKSRPYVLRLFDTPLKNLEITGIARERVESMEQRMKADVVAELKRYDGRLLLHDEELKEGGGYVIVPVWETVKESDVQTPQDVFESIIQEGYNVDYLRVPITDEQAPIPAVFDELVNRVKVLSSPTDAIFNCQMGRGRTTTGMVITCVVDLILGGQKLLIAALESPYTSRSDETRDDFSGIIAYSDDTNDASSVDAKDQAKNNTQRYLAGEYKITTQLLGVLSYGKLAKRIVDLAIDRCSHMQNLREAIMDFKIRLESLKPGSKAFMAYHGMGLNYLMRYFYLVAFAGYLIEMVVPSASVRSNTSSMIIPSETTAAAHASNEESIHGSEDNKVSRERNVIIDTRGKSVKQIDPAKLQVRFSEWLQERREITFLAGKSNQDFS